MNLPAGAPGAAPVLTVSELNRAVRGTLEASFPLLWVGGEISNLTRAASGHWYFSLKDAQAQVRCVMFRNRNQSLDFRPENGMAVEARALVSLYEPRGDYQLNVELLRPAGLGALYAAFAQLRERLAREGLFDADAKRALPAFPRAIGVVSSPAAAALRDVLTTLARRNPGIPVIIYPTPVQGAGAGARIAAAIATAGRRAECDVLILCRGGGSIEDLWAFNEEAVARAIRACPLPVVTGVGHETDFTIADFAADLRAATPTAAAAACAPDAAELRGAVSLLRSQLERRVTQCLQAHMQRLDFLSRRLVHPGERIAQRASHLGHLEQRLRSAAARRVEAARWRADALAARLAGAAPDLQSHARRQEELARRLGAAAGLRLERARQALGRIEAHLLHLNPDAVLQRGYSIVRRPDGSIVRDGASLAAGDELELTLARGWARSRVTESG